MTDATFLFIFVKPRMYFMSLSPLALAVTRARSTAWLEREQPRVYPSATNQLPKPTGSGGDCPPSAYRRSMSPCPKHRRSHRVHPGHQPLPDSYGHRAKPFRRRRRRKRWRGSRRRRRGRLGEGRGRLRAAGGRELPARSPGGPGHAVARSAGHDRPGADLNYVCRASTARRNAGMP